MTHPTQVPRVQAVPQGWVFTPNFDQQEIHVVVVVN
jgi:hypothetical protein